VNVLKPHLQTTVFTLLAAGKSQHEISRVTKIDRKTIRRINKSFLAEQAKSPGVATGSPSQIPPPRPPGPIRQSTSACEPHRDFIKAQVGLHRNFTAIYQDLVDRFGFSAGYNSVKRFAGSMIEQDPAQFDRLEFAAGEEVQVDYGEGALTRCPGTDRYRRPRLFVMTLRFSRRSFRRVVWKSSQEIWAKLHEQAWRYFGGTASYVVYDYVTGNIIQLMCPTLLCAHAIPQATIMGGSRMFGHIIGYNEFNQSSSALSSFQTARDRTSAEVPQLTSHSRSACALARSVNSA
jgi:transposase